MAMDHVELDCWKLAESEWLGIRAFAKQQWLGLTWSSACRSPSHQLG